MNNKIVEIVTSRILDSLKSGAAPWRKTWKGCGMPMNLISGKPYRGMNVFILMSQSFSDPRWLTFNQAKSKGGMVRKGEKGTPIVFWNFIKETKNGQETGRKIPLMRYYTVFNVTQVDGLNLPSMGEKREHTPLESAERIIQGMPNRPEIVHGGGQASYGVDTDKVSLPVPESFESGEAYYSTAFHELAHATGHATRLGRDMKNFFGSHKYSFEELVAEMTAAYLSAHCGIEDKTLDNSAAYVQNWLKVLEGDPSMLISAASKAQKACDYILGGSASEPTTSGDESAD